MLCRLNTVEADQAVQVLAGNLLNAECQMQNAEHRTPNAEFRSAVHHVKHVLSGSVNLL